MLPQNGIYWITDILGGYGVLRPLLIANGETKVQGLFKLLNFDIKVPFIQYKYGIHGKMKYTRCQRAGNPSQCEAE